MGNTDRMIRLLAAAAIVILYLTDTITGVTALFAGILALIFIATSVISFCPLYLPFGLSTTKKDKA